MDFNVINYNISTLYNTTTINFNSTLNGNIVSSTDWRLQGNPIIPYIHLVYDLPEGNTISSLTFDTGYEAFLGQYNLTMQPGSYFGQLYEYYPLNLTAYMEQPVEWKIFEKTDGNMCAVIDIFPFQYYPNNGTLIFYNNFSISTSERERTATIDSVSTDKRLYVKGDVAEITVNCTGSALINVTVDGVGSMPQQSTGSNVFTVDTSELTAGSHDVDIKLYDDDSLIDEMLTSISVVDSLITMSLETSVNSTAMGSPLNLSIRVTNLGGSPTVVSPDLVVDAENVSRISLGDLTLSAHESKFINTTIATDDMPSGMVIFYAEAELGTITVNTNYETVTIYEDVSDIIIEYEIEPDVIHLTFPSPYVDNVHYSLDKGVNTSLYEPYDIDISYLMGGSTHNITVYADDVFGNENSTSFQFVSRALAAIVYVPDNYTTIQAAINDARSGSTIKVFAGTYTEHLVIDKPLKLIGKDESTTIIDGGGSGNCVNIKADNVEIRGFTIQNSAYGIWVESSDGCTISGNIIHDSNDGIRLTDSNNNVIINNIIFNNVWYFSGIHLSSSHDNVIRDNDLVENGRGVSLRDSNNNRIYHNNFVDSIFNQAYDNTGTNSWDNGPTAGGNYWSDHACIGNPSDKPYSIGSNSIDHYPFQKQSGWVKDNQPPIPDSAGAISVTSSPSGATIELEGFVGPTITTPHTFANVPAGTHTIKLTLEGYHDWSTKVYVMAGETTYVDAILTPIQTAGPISVASSPQYTLFPSSNKIYRS